jgi:hypothetical protein
LDFIRFAVRATPAEVIFRSDRYKNQGLAEIKDFLKPLIIPGESFTTVCEGTLII